MLKGGIVGFGRMGLTHFSILNNHPEVNFVAVCDSSNLMRKNIRKFMGLETFDDYRAMFEAMDLDFVIVATPTVTHAETVACAIDKGVHVFVEKPFALNTDDGRKIVEAVNQAGLVNQVGYVIRFNDVFREVKKLLNAGAIGELHYFRMEMFAPTVLKEVKSGWRSKKNQGGGCLYDFASHGIDLINFIVGQPVDVAGSVLQNINSVAVEDSVSTTMLYDGNLHGNLLVNWCDASYRKPAYKMELYGRRGKIIADLHAYKVYFKEKPLLEGFEQGWNARYITEFVEPVRYYVRGFEFTRQLDYFIDSILNNRKESLCSFADGLAADMVIEKITRDDAGRRR